MVNLRSNFAQQPVVRNNVFRKKQQVIVKVILAVVLVLILCQYLKVGQLTIMCVNLRLLQHAIFNYLVNVKMVGHLKMI